MSYQTMKSKLQTYEKPTVRRHAVIMTMAPQGSKMGHGLFPFVTKRFEKTLPLTKEHAYRRG
ncbi:hypothetical protein HN592_02205 [Candidatus Woesearchaeota archaeon]|jgi:hypothetical protein|nr:hypothetical protein [Candidatus Woesearchaeota archaeon]MBT4368025.1 hypothetical protein [Candidatus Woesearchaeota archaeon]MBT4712513.1 hypothetical protein [Candidatus Woesearchaeota archaeon]MBT6639426.1 hypothetical protein [Candidatus Woesearchaeota archaeon]MBT7133598.1 hypothetical protein [Candidatus Woesearchaeota archaeon]